MTAITTAFTAPPAASPLIRLHANDNVLVAKTALSLGQELPGIGARARAQVPAGHKVAACRIAQGERILKYDTVIGMAARDIEAGDYVHSHNMALVDFERDPAFGRDVRPVDYVPEAERATFMGFVRPDGRVGTRNFIGILSSVNCSATVIKNIAAHFTPERLAAFPHVDGVAAFAQTSGCGMSSPSEHFDVLRRTLAGYARHPNLAGVLIVGLGCERNQVSSLVESQGLETSKLMRTMVMQEVGGTRATIEAGIRRHSGDAARSECGQAPACAGEPPEDRAGVRRLGWFFRHHGQSGAGRGHGHPGAPRRHRHPVGDP
jgi:altronate hydrolase